MVLKPRTTFFIILGILLAWFLYLERTILTPFILAGIFAYIFNPIINFSSHKIHLPRTLSVVIVYLFIVFILVFLGTVITRGILHESSELKDYIDQATDVTEQQMNSLPNWIKPTVDEMLISLQQSKLFSPHALFAFFPHAISRIVSLFIFLFSGFYFLKEGRNIFDKLLNLMPSEYKVEVEIIFRKINAVFAGYLRGQLFLVFFVSLTLFLALSILGVKFALILAIFSGFAEIIPFIGPITAGTVAVMVVLLTGGITNFSLTMFEAVIIVILIYFVLRQFQDYFVTPHVMGRITKIHPFIIFFAVLSGGHLFGLIGYILAVPIVATVKILLQFFWDKVNEGKQ